MSFYTEQDPLLPGDKGSPEIHGSRPQSINHVEVNGEEDDVLQDGPKGSLFNNAAAMICGILFIFIAVSIFVSGDSLGDAQPPARTIDQRVNQILADTPLIGIYSRPQNLSVC